MFSRAEQPTRAARSAGRLLPRRAGGGRVDRDKQRRATRGGAGAFALRPRPGAPRMAGSKKRREHANRGRLTGATASDAAVAKMRPRRRTRKNSGCPPLLTPRQGGYNSLILRREHHGQEYTAQKNQDQSQNQGENTEQEPRRQNQAPRRQTGGGKAQSGGGETDDVRRAGGKRKRTARSRSPNDGRGAVAAFEPQRQERRAVFLSQRRHPGLHDRGLRYSRPLSRVPAAGRRDPRRIPRQPRLA